MCGRDLAKQFKAWAGGFQRLVEPDIDNTPPAAACLDALFGQIKWARSIENFKIHLFPSDEVPMFDMQQFVASHKRLEHLRIIARHFNTGPSWCTAWSNSCSHAAQETWLLWMWICKWRIARTDTPGLYQGGEYADQGVHLSPIIQGFRLFSRILLIAWKQCTCITFTIARPMEMLWGLKIFVYWQLV